MRLLAVSDSLGSREVGAVHATSGGAGGGYSGIPHGNPVGPEGGQVLVDRTVEAIGAIWKESK